MLWLFRKLILISFWLSVVFSALLAVFAVGVGQLLPYLDYYRPQIEQNLKQITGYPVALDKIDGVLEGVDPTVSVSGFHLAVNGESAINVSEMRLRIDTVKSLLSLSPQFTYIRFVGPTVDLQESDGHWRLKGAEPSRNVGNEVGVERVLDYLSSQQNFSVYNAKLNIESDGYGDHGISIPHLYLFKKSYESLLASKLYLDDYASPFEVNARIDQSLGLVGNYRIKASVTVPNIQLPLANMLPNNPYLLSSIEVGGNVWIDALVGKELDIRSDNARFNVAFDDSQHYEIRSPLDLKYSFKKSSLRIDLPRTNVEDQDGIRYPETAISYDWSSVTERSNVGFERADLGIVHKIAAHFLPVESNAAKIVNGLSPRGMAKNGSVVIWQQNNEWSFQLLSNLQSASIDGYNGIPKASNINAVLSLSQDDGYIDFRGNDSELFFDQVYDDIWRVDFLSGYVGWQQEQDAFIVTGRDLIVNRNGADLSGNFRLEVRQDLPDWIALDLHGRDISLKDRLTYIPTEALGEELTTWIGDAFSDEKGLVERVDVLVQTDLDKGASPHVRLQLDADNVDVAFDQNWPNATNVNAAFEYDESGVSVRILSGSLLSLPLNDLLITVPVNDGTADWLNLSGALQEDANRVLTTLRATPLADSVLQPFEDWELKGVVKGKFDVSIPFEEKKDPIVSLNLNFADNDLAIDSIDLVSRIKSGRFNYASERGISDSEFNLEALGGNSKLVLSSENAADGELAVLGEISGEVDVRKVAAWQSLPEAMQAKLSGKTSYKGQLAVNRSQMGQVDVSIDSDLLGAAIQLPEPIGKDKTESKALHLKIMQHLEDLVVDANYDTFSRARVLVQNGEFAGGQVILNGGVDQSITGNIPKGLVVLGDFEHLNVQEWQDSFADLAAGESTPESEAVHIPEIPSWLSKLDLIVDQVKVNPANTLHNFKVTYNSVTNQPILVSSDEMNFSLDNAGGRPDLHFGFLSWNTSKDDESESKPNSKSSPIAVQQIPNMKLSIDQLYLNGNPYGDWQLSITRDGNKVRIDPISSKLTTGSFSGHLVWLDDQDNGGVELVVAVKGKDLEELTAKFSNEAFVSSDKYAIDVSLKWKGHPFYFDRESVNGNITFSAEDGNFSKVDELPPFLKALGIFNIGALSRRLTLDFSDVYEPGLSYDEFNGALTLKNGVIKTTNPVTIISPSAELVLEGEADLVTETLNETLTATFPLTGTLPLAGLLWGTPQLAGLLFITDKLIGDQLSKVTSVQYKVEGPFSNPSLTPIKFRPSGK